VGGGRSCTTTRALLLRMLSVCVKARNLYILGREWVAAAIQSPKFAQVSGGGVVAGPFSRYAYSG
jgi:hypothetical protein